jgi:tetratricopeptide (TPR) repeat protein
MGRPRRLRQQALVPPAPRPTLLPPARALTLPLAFTLLLIVLGLLPDVRHNPHLRWSFWGAGAGLLAWNAGMLAIARGRGRTFAVEVVLREQHYLQAGAQISILLYWGWYWRQVYDAAPLIAGQLAFAYAFDALLVWSRRDTYTLGFGPFPIIFSTNLFLWFKPDWFYLQFLMVAVGFAAKELIRWNKQGRQTHIFNPSSFALMLCSVILLLTGKTGISWGQEISATQLIPPHIYLWIFLVTLPAQFLFGVAPMTWAAVATSYTLGAVCFGARPVPIAVFLGMHLLFTDPSTSPRTELGRLIFGVLYGLSVVGLYALLTFLKVPSFYDKLLPVPILNLLIQGVDKAARLNPLKRFDPGALGRGLLPQRRNLAYMSMWAITFITMQVLTGTRATLDRGNVLMEQGRIEEALAQYREFLRTDPADSDGHDKLGVALMREGRFEEAAASFQRSIDLQPSVPGPHDNLGVALMQAGRLDAAVASFQRAVALQPDSTKALNNLGTALMATGRFSGALVPLQRAVELQPNSPEALNSLGEALMKSGRLKDAVASLQHAVDLKPDYAEGRYNLAQALATVGQPRAAVGQLREALRVRPDWLPALMSLASLEATEPDAPRDPGDAVRLASRAADLTGRRDPQVLDVLAAVYAAAGRFGDASRTAEAAQALASAGSNPHLAAQLGERVSVYRSMAGAR